MLYLQNATSGLAAGVTYGLVALALVIVFRATGVVNFAAGEMATFTTFIAWELIAPAGLPFFVTMAIVAVIAALLGLVVYVLVIHPARRRPEFVTVMITFGLYELFNGLSNSLWNPSPRTFPAPVSGAAAAHRRRSSSPGQNLGNAAVAVVAMLLLAGAVPVHPGRASGLRATADNPAAARVVGITPARMYALGWAMASVAGAIAGMLFANVLLLSPTMMGNVLVFSLVSVIVGGLESPVGAIVGGLVIGVVAGVLAGVHGIGPNLATPVMLGPGHRRAAAAPAGPVRPGRGAQAMTILCSRLAARRCSRSARIALGTGALIAAPDRRGRRAARRRFWRRARSASGPSRQNRASDGRWSASCSSSPRSSGRRSTCPRSWCWPSARSGWCCCRARPGRSRSRRGRSSAPARTPARC